MCQPFLTQKKQEKKLIHEISLATKEKNWEENSLQTTHQISFFIQASRRLSPRQFGNNKVSYIKIVRQAVLYVSKYYHDNADKSFLKYNKFEGEGFILGGAYIGFKK